MHTSLSPLTHHISVLRAENKARAGFTLEGVKERFARHQTQLREANASRDSTDKFVLGHKKTINGSVSIEGLGMHMTNLPTGKDDSDTPNEDGNEDAGNRQLQTSCASGSSFNIASSVFPLMEGCHSVSTETSGGEAIYIGTTSLVVALAASDDADADVSKTRKILTIHGRWVHR